MTVRQWFGAYQAFVVRNDDPTGAQRVTLQIPQVLGTATSQWAAPASATATAAPSVGTVVTAMFLGGDINHPVYLSSFTASSGASVSSVSAGDASIIIGGTGSAPTVRTNSLDQLASLHPPTGNVNLNSQNIIGLANGSAATDAAAFGQILSLKATTGAAGYTLVNGTGTIMSWTAPSDGQMHRVIVTSMMDITTTETGGAISAVGTAPNGAAFSLVLFSAGATAQITSGTRPIFLVQAGSVFSVQQTSALTAGAATLWAEIWAL